MQTMLVKGRALNMHHCDGTVLGWLQRHVESERQSVDDLLSAQEFHRLEQELKRLVSKAACGRATHLAVQLSFSIAVADPHERRLRLTGHRHQGMALPRVEPWNASYPPVSTAPQIARMRSRTRPKCSIIAAALDYMNHSLAALLNLMPSLKTQTGKFISSRHTLETAGTSRRFMQALLSRLEVAEIADATSLDVRH